ncbi:trypsin-1 isoform 2-T3 [Glossina fuscipes fuscipes]
MCFNFHLLLLWLMIAYDRTATTIASSIASQYYNKNQFATDCGVRPSRQELPVTVSNHSRTAKIIAGTYTKDGQFPWQASLELLHPSLGFLGHWCGAVLIHQYWILSAAHCVHNDLFNLPLPPLWTVVLGDYDRAVESGYEQRIPIEKIFLHRKYENFLHDLVLMKLSMPANLSKKSNIRRICLPFLFGGVQSNSDDHSEETLNEQLSTTADFDINEIPEKFGNFLRSVQTQKPHHNVTIPTMKQLMDLKILNRLKRINQVNRIGTVARTKRRNDRYMNFQQYDGEKVDINKFNEHRQHLRYVDNTKELPYMDCIATGWGKANISGDLTDLLLKTSVPLHNNRRCKEAYGSFVRIHRGHLCAGKLNGKGGTCVGDSGGPLQCRLTKDGPWILAGITSFGSGCAVAGYPDVYVRISRYMKWIKDTIAYE